MKKGSFIPVFNYDTLTPCYDFFVDILGFGYKQRVKIAKLLHLKRGENLLDVGCGTGSLLFASKQLYPTNEMAGIDPDDKVLNLARDKFRLKGLNIELIQASAAKLPFKNSSRDVIVSTLVFHHLPLEVKVLALKEIKRVLKRNGRFLLVDFGKADKLWMKCIYPLEKLFGIREAETIKDNLDGVLPSLLKNEGFRVKEVAKKSKGIEYLLAKHTK